MTLSVEMRRKKGPPKGSKLNLSAEQRAKRAENSRWNVAQRRMRFDHLLWTRRIVTDAGCHEWTGYRYPPEKGGYGLIHRDGHGIAVHRYAWQLAHGPLRDDEYVLHKCDNPPCFRLSHLFIGDAATNARDMVAKGRSKFQKDPDAFRGERHWARRKPEVALANMARARALRWPDKEPSK